MLSSASPESVGISSERLQRAFGLLQSWLNDGVVSAIASVVARRGKIVGEFYGGRVSAQSDAKPVVATTLFHTASIGKPQTATAVMLLVEAGRISLDELVGSIVQDCNPEWAERITVRHLLTHTSGLPQDPGGEILDGLPEGADTPTYLKNFPKSKLAVPIGSKVEYSNVGFGLLGLIIEAVSGLSFPAFMRECLFTPARMNDTYHSPPEHLHARIAHVMSTPNEGTEFERYNSKHALTLTHPAGNVVQTAADVATFFQMFLDGGKARGRTVIAPATAQLMTSNHTRGLRGGIEGFMTWDECAWGLGFDLRDHKHPHFAGEFTSSCTFGHTGVAGTFAWADPARDLVCVMLANRMLYNFWNQPRWSRYSSAVVACVTD